MLLPGTSLRCIGIPRKIEIQIQRLQEKGLVIPAREKDLVGETYSKMQKQSSLRNDLEAQTGGQ